MTAEWRNNLRPASFRGVSFKVESHELSGGRRGVQHEYAQKEKPYTEDTGRKGRQFTVEGYIVGTDYFGDRDDLLAALEAEGPGELIHPYLGRQVVNCFDFKISESARDGGLVTVRMTFAESGDVEFPAASADTTYLVDQSAGTAIDKAKSDFSDKFSISGLPGFVIDDATRKINDFSSLLEKSSNSFSFGNDKVANLAYAIRGLKGNALDLMSTPSKLADAMASTMNLLTQASNDVKEIYSAMRGFFGFGSEDIPIPITTSTRQKQQDNRSAMDQFIQIVAVSEGARASTQIEFENTADAIEVRDTLNDKTDELMEQDISDDMFMDLQDLRSQVVGAIPPPDRAIATIVTIKNQKTMPSLVLTYDLYENPQFESDLVKRNKLRHPGFVPGGEELEVLQVE